MMFKGGGSDLELAIVCGVAEADRAKHGSKAKVMTKSVAKAAPFISKSPQAKKKQTNISHRRDGLLGSSGSGFLNSPFSLSP